MKSKTFTRITKVLLLAVLFLLVGVRGWAIDRYWIGGGSANFNDGAHWSANTGGGAIGGIINWASTDKAYFDGNSGTIGTIFLINNYNVGSIALSGTQTVTFESSGGVYTLTVNGASGSIVGSSNNSLVISSNTTLSSTVPISGGSASTFIYNVIINGTLTTSNYLNSTYLTVNNGGLLKTSFANTNSSGGWWYAGNSPVLNYITLNGTVEFSGNNQSVPGLGYTNLKFSGLTAGTTNVFRGDVTVFNELNIQSGKINLNSKTLNFQGTTFTNSGNIYGNGTIKFRTNASNSAQSFTGTGTTSATSLEVAAAYDINMTSSVSLNVEDMIFSNAGNFNNSTSKLTIGNGTNSAVTFDDGGSNVATGSFTLEPIYSGALTLNYLTQDGIKTTGAEMPSTFENLVITNPNGVRLATNKTVTNSIDIQNPGTGGVLNLNGKTLTFTGNTFTNKGTISGVTSSTLLFQSGIEQTLDLSLSVASIIDILIVDDPGLTVLGSSNEQLIANNIYFKNSGGITNTSTTTTIGSGGSAIIEFNNTHGGSCGNFGVAPTFNVTNSGSSGLTVNYKTESAGRTMGVEMPATAANIYVSNTNGITDNGSYSLTGTLNIAAGYLQINPNKDMTVNGATTITPASGIKIKSSSAGTGSLITNGSVGGTGTTYIERYITGNTALNGALKYHQVSVPLIGNQNGNTSYLSAVWMHSYLFDYTESDDSWFNWNSGTGNFCPTNKGYLIYHRLWPGQATADTTYTMTGKLNTGSYSPPVTKVGNGFNLIPNPYPSSINWNASSGWSFNNMSSAIWLYNATTNNYATVLRTGSGTIASGTGTSSAIQVGQAFFVKATGSSPTVSMNDNVRIHNSAQGFLKNSDAIANSLRLNIEGNSSADEILVNFAFDATTGYDSQYDAEKFTGPETSPQLSALNVSSDKYSIIGLPLSSDETVLPLNLNMNFSGELTFTASQLESFTTETSIKLEDKQLAKTIDLRSTPTYSFTHTPDDADDRFMLHFGSVLGFDDNHALLTSSVTVNGKQISVSYPITSNKKHLSASIFDTQGRLLKQVSLNGTGNDSFTLSETSGVYLLRLTLPGGNETHKIVVL